MFNNLSCGMFDFTEIWHRVSLNTTSDHSQMFKVKGTEWKCCLIATLLSFKKLGQWI